MTDDAPTTKYGGIEWRSFTREDWFAFAGAAPFLDGDTIEPLMSDDGVRITVDGKEIGQYLVIMDASGVEFIPETDATAPRMHLRRRGHDHVAFRTRERALTWYAAMFPTNRIALLLLHELGAIEL
jgi:hypothetical protein